MKDRRRIDATSKRRILETLKFLNGKKTNEQENVELLQHLSERMFNCSQNAVVGGSEQLPGLQRL